jgi:hypothetical protein
MADKTHTNKTILGGLGQSISQLENVVSASLRPLPTETGNGTYIAESTETGLVAGLVQDMATVDVGDIRTLVEVIKNSATGEPVDDKSYVMERTIQVVYAAALRRRGRDSWLINLDHLASCWFACDIAKWGRIDQVLSKDALGRPRASTNLVSSTSFNALDESLIETAILALIRCTARLTGLAM